MYDSWKEIGINNLLQIMIIISSFPTFMKIMTLQLVYILNVHLM
jgi:hypothetical protein